MEQKTIKDLGLTDSQMLDLVEKKLTDLNIKKKVGSLELSYGGFMALVHVGETIGKIMGDLWCKRFEEHFIERNLTQSEYLKEIDKILKEYKDVDLRNQIESILLKKMKTEARN